MPEKKKVKWKDLPLISKIAIWFFGVIGGTFVLFIIIVALISSGDSDSASKPLVNDETAEESEPTAEESEPTEQELRNDARVIAGLEAVTIAKQTYPRAKGVRLLDLGNPNIIAKAAAEGWQDIPGAEPGWRTYEVYSYVRVTDDLAIWYTAKIALDIYSPHSNNIVYFLEFDI